MSGDFWSPTLTIDRQDDGVITLRQTGELPEYLPTLADYLDLWADKTPHQTWLARRDKQNRWQCISYAQARDWALKAGSSLLRMGLGPDKPLLILSENSLEHGILGLACAYVGIPYAPVSPAYALRSNDHAKLKSIAALLQPGAVFADDSDAFAPAIRAINTPAGNVISVTGNNGEIQFMDLQNEDTALAIKARQRVHRDTVVKYLFTSGSTGSPKAVINTNGMICAMQAMVRDCYRFVAKEPPVVLDWAPWNHTAAGNKVSYLVLTNGGSYYIDDGKPVPGKIQETVANLRDISCTWYFNVPAGWDLLVDTLENDPDLANVFFSRLKMMFYAGAGMAQHTWDRLQSVARQATGHDVLLATSLGATETAPFALACTDIQEQAGNVGLPARGLTMKLVPSGDKLELRLKGPSITPGYYGDPVRTAEAFDEDGFYCMGDALRPVDAGDLAKGFIFDGRIAENFKLNTGTWVAVGAVRTHLVDAMAGLISDAVITGENESELGALLLLSEKAKAMKPGELQDALLHALRKAATQSTGSSSCVRRAIILQQAPEFDRGEITEKGSLNQRALRANRADTIAELYSDSKAVLRVTPDTT